MFDIETVTRGVQSWQLHRLRIHVRSCVSCQIGKCNNCKTHIVSFTSLCHSFSAVWPTLSTLFILISAKNPPGASTSTTEYHFFLPNVFHSHSQENYILVLTVGYHQTSFHS
jgi:hypothetical protein